MHKNKIYIAATGGTIDSYYDSHKPAPYEVPLDGHTEIPQAMNLLGIKDYGFKQYANTDSKSLPKNTIRKIIADAISRDYDKVIITMGTDRMPNCAEFAQRILPQYGHKAQNVRIVFTGAMQPLRDENKDFFSESDAVKNLKFAYENLQNESFKGVRAAMHVNGNPEMVLCDPKHLKKRVTTDGEGHVKKSGFEYDAAAAKSCEQQRQTYSR